MRSLGLLIAGALVVQLAAAGPVGAAPPETLDVQDDRITGEFRDMEPAGIIQAIADASGAEIIGGIDANEPMTILLDDVAVDQALDRVLGGQSYTVVYGADGGMRRIRLHGGPQTAPVRTASKSKSKSKSSRAVRPHELFSVEVKIGPNGPLYDELGTDTTTLGTLFDLATQSEKAHLRLAAVDAGISAVEADSGLQSTVDQLLDTTDDAQLANLASMGAGDRASELVSRILSRTRRPGVRQRAVTILRTLRSQR